MIRIKELRAETGLNQGELAKAINTTQRNISNWENGINEPDFRMLISLAQYFDVSVDYLLGLEEETQTKREMSLSTVEKKLLKLIRELSQEKKQALIKILEKEK